MSWEEPSGNEDSRGIREVQRRVASYDRRVEGPSPEDPTGEGRYYRQTTI